MSHKRKKYIWFAFAFQSFVLSLLLPTTTLILTFAGHCLLIYNTLDRYGWTKIRICPSVWMTGIWVVFVESKMMDTFLNSKAKRNFRKIRKKSSELDLKKCTEITFIASVGRPDDSLVEKSRAAHDHTVSFWILFWLVPKWHTDWLKTMIVSSLKSKRTILSSSSSCVYLGRNGERKLLAMAAIRDRNADDDALFILRVRPNIIWKTFVSFCFRFPIGRYT